MGTFCGVTDGRLGTQEKVPLPAERDSINTMQSFLSVSKGSDIEADVQDVSILDPVIPAFQAEEALFTDALL